MVRTCGQGYHHGRNLARVAEIETHHGTEFSRVSRGHLSNTVNRVPGVSLRTGANQERHLR